MMSNMSPGGCLCCMYCFSRPNAPLSRGVRLKQYAGVYSTMKPLAAIADAKRTEWWIEALSKTRTERLPGKGVMKGTCARAAGVNSRAFGCRVPRRTTIVSTAFMNASWSNVPLMMDQLTKPSMSKVASVDVRKPRPE